MGNDKSTTNMMGNCSKSSNRYQELFIPVFGASSATKIDDDSAKPIPSASSSHHTGPEVRRGADKAEIHSLAFSFDVRWLAMSSDKGTIHVFSLKLDSEALGNDGLKSLPEQPSSPRLPMTSISFMKGVLPKYFSSEWSLAQFHLNDGTRYIVSFGRQESTVVIVGMDGR